MGPHDAELRCQWQYGKFGNFIGRKKETFAKTPPKITALFCFCLNLRRSKPCHPGAKNIQIRDIPG
jgi:hypothetical protein